MIKISFGLVILAASFSVTEAAFSQAADSTAGGRLNGTSSKTQQTISNQIPPTTADRTGIAAVLYPLRGQEIACVARFSTGAGFSYHRAYVDSNGNPYVSAGVGGHGSYVSGLTVQFGNFETQNSAKTTLTMNGLEGYGTTCFSEGCSGDGSCTVNWR